MKYTWGRYFNISPLNFDKKILYKIYNKLNTFLLC